MSAKPLNISVIDFFELSAILNIKNLFANQKVILKVVTGEHLDTKKTETPRDNDHETPHDAGYRAIQEFKSGAVGLYLRCK